jgi:hypothetical protein
MAAHALAYFDKQSPLPEPRVAESITHDEFEHRSAGLRGGEALIMKQMERLFNYLTLDRLFDTTNTDAILEGSGRQYPWLLSGQ